MRALPSCSCGRLMMPVIEAVCVFPGMAYSGLLCSYCDGGVLPLDSLMMWSELEMLERGSWPARIQDLLPQAEPPENQ